MRVQDCSGAWNLCSRVLDYGEIMGCHLGIPSLGRERERQKQTQREEKRREEPWSGVGGSLGDGKVHPQPRQQEAEGLFL